MRSVSTWATHAPITKADADEGRVYGIASQSLHADGSPVVDHDDEWIPPDELRAAAYRYVAASRKGQTMHTPGQTGELIDSLFVTPESLGALLKAFGVSADLSGFKGVGWWTGYQITDPSSRAAARSGTYAAFSIGGTATREDA